MESLTTKFFAFGDFELDAAKRRLLKSGETVALNAKTFDLLLALVENRGRIVSKDELLDKVWEGQFVEENNLTVQIAALRKIFGEKKGEHKFIATVPGKGYKFVAEINEPNEGIVIENHTVSRLVFKEQEEIEKPPKQILTKKNFSRPYFIAASALSVIALSVFGYWFFAKNLPSAPVESIAVLPFVYENGGAENEYLSDGMTESLINNLSQLPNLTVKARNSVFHYKGKQIEPPKIAAELSVQAVLLGRINERGGSLILSLELIDAKTNNHLWGEQYIRKTSDLAILQTEIARDVSNKLHQKLAKGEALPKGQTVNSEAYQLYLKGRYLWNKRNHEDHLKAVASFEQAIALDPNFALAYAGLGDVYTVDSFNLPDEEKDAKARPAALKALDIEPNLAEAYTVLAKIEWNSFNRAKSEEYFKRAIQLNPSYASLRQWYAEFLIQQVRTEEAIAEITRALELDPLSAIINSDAVYIYTMARQEDRAIAQANKMLELDADWHRAYEWRGAAYESKGDFAAALNDFEKANEFSSKPNDKKEQTKNEIKQVREALEKSGKQGYWQRQLEIFKSAPASEIGYYYPAIAYANLGDKKNALDALEKAFDNKEDQINLTKVEPYFDILRTEPRYQALLRRVGLEP